ncbi:Major inner capsid protein VP3 [Dissostichus eleginoides]|uniref:Major inner capsid protein VP3 n=1 Tax=Dissostichus eleginoides TaxID=100907 RepID=A0AAD9BVP2_DISEL|nr:Major inner capsid protein VP3 [Dissostichus eleginoides]
MPSQEEDGESHPICFVVQSITNSTTKYQSELRCVIVTVGNEPTITTAVPSTTTPVTGVSKQGRAFTFNPQTLRTCPFVPE